MPHPPFLQRQLVHLVFAICILALSLALGMWGYEHYEHLAWRDASSIPPCSWAGWDRSNRISQNRGQGRRWRAAQRGFSQVVCLIIRSLGRRLVRPV